MSRLVHVAAQQMQSGRTTDARNTLDGLLKEQPSHIEALHLRSRLARQEGDAKLAEQLLEQAISLSPDRAVFHYDLGILALDGDRAREAIAHFERANQIKANVPFVLVHLAVAQEQAGDHYAAAVSYQQCWTLALDNGRALGKLPPNLQDTVLRGKEMIADTVRGILTRELNEIRGQHGNQDASRMERLIESVTGRAPEEQPYPRQQPTKMFFPGLPDEPFLDREPPEWVRHIEGKTDTIREEFLALSEDANQIQPYIQFDPNSPTANHWKDVNHSTAWGSIHIYEHGKLNTAVAEKCPETVAALEQAPLMKLSGHAPEIMFSVLKPHTHIPPHHGSVNGRLIVHLPLIVPENCGQLRVAGQGRGWETGRCTIFDDTYEHEAWNDSDETRVVLIFDIWHPDVNPLEQQAFIRFNQIISDMNRDIFGEQA